MGSYQSWCLTHYEKASTEKGCCLSGALERVAELELSAANGTEIMWQNAKLTKRVAELEAARNVAGVLDGVLLVDWLREELSASADCRERVAEFESATLTPRPCVTCKKAAEQMRDDAAMVAYRAKVDSDNPEFNAICDRDKMIGDAIRAMPLPTCCDCKPLAPDVKVVYCREFKPQNQAALHDQLNELIELANMNGLYDAADFVAERRK